MGRGYKGDTGHHHSITENLPSLTSDYEYHNGYFGDKGISSGVVRNIKSDEPIKTAKDFYDKAAHGSEQAGQPRLACQEFYENVRPVRVPGGFTAAGKGGLSGARRAAGRQRRHACGIRGNGGPASGNVCAV